MRGLAFLRALLSNLLSKASAFTTPPTPITIRKYGLLILLFLAVPKICWDLLRLRSYAIKDEAPEGKTDPAIRVLRLALSKALSDLNRCWEQVLIPYCQDEIVDITPMVTYFQTEAQVLIKQLAQDDLEYVEKQKQEEKAKANKKKKKQLKKEQAKQNRANRTLKDSQKDATIKEKGTDQAQAGHGLEDAGSSSDSDSDSDSSSSSSTDSDSDDETELEKDADAEDGFLEQWCETLHNTINKPMYEAFKIKEDDAAEEEKVRAMVRGIIFVGEAFITALKTRRRRNALKKFMLSKQKLLVDVDNEKIRDENNRDRNKLELFTNGRNQEYAYFISDKDLQVGLDKYGRRYDTVTSLKDVRLTPSEWQIECWNDWDTQERWLRYRVQWLPEEWWADVILPVYIQFAVQARLVDINIEHELGSIKTQRFYKLINFINTEMCGQWHQRVLIVLAWIIGAVKTVVDTTEWHYRSSLLIQTIEQTLTARRGGSGRGGGRGGTSLMDVCVSIVVMKSSSALLADLLDKVKEAGKGGNCCVLWGGGGVEGWKCGSPVQTVSHLYCSCRMQSCLQ